MDIELNHSATALHVTLTSKIGESWRCKCLHVPVDLTELEWHAFKREVERELFAEKEEQTS